MTDLLPDSPGSYALLLQLDRERWIEVGSLGLVRFLPGDYVYLGSALGPGGLKARLGRHLQGKGRRRWHIDFLRPVCHVTGTCYLPQPSSWKGKASTPLECRWSQTLSRLAEAKVPAPGFGATDCQAGCPAHLIYFSAGIPMEVICQMLADVNSVEAIRFGV